MYGFFVSWPLVEVQLYNYCKLWPSWFLYRYSLLFFRSSLSFRYRRSVPSEGKPTTKVCTSHLKLVKRENIIRLQDKQYLLAGNNNICGHKINLPSNKMLNLTVGYAKVIKGKILQKKLLTKKTKQKERVEVQRQFLRAESLFLEFIITIIRTFSPCAE